MERNVSLIWLHIMLMFKLWSWKLFVDNGNCLIMIIFNLQPSCPWQQTGFIGVKIFFTFCAGHSFEGRRGTGCVGSLWHSCIWQDRDIDHRRVNLQGNWTTQGTWAARTLLHTQLWNRGAGCCHSNGTWCNPSYCTVSPHISLPPVEAGPP